MEDIAEDVYTLVSKDSKKSLLIDLTTPFILNSIATIFNVPYEDILIKNSLGELVEEVKKEDLLTITELNDIGVETTYYFINIVDILLDPIEVEGYTYSKLYPLKELDEYEYGLVRGQLITGKDILVNIKGYELIKTPVEIVKVVNYTNGNYIKRVDNNYTYYSEQILSDLSVKNIVKLNNTAIEKGSIQIQEYFKENSEYTSTPTDLTRYLNISTIQEPEYLQVDTDQYLKE